MEKLAHCRVLSPFGAQPMTGAHMDHAREQPAPAPIGRVNKWALFRELCTARLAFGVSDRDLTVLNALLSFHKPTELEDEGTPIVVFPSNDSLCARAHGMAESTLRRHLAALVRAGMIARRDSPNGKRYRTGHSAFGFDLRPFLLRVHDIASAAAEVLQAAAERREASTRLTLVLRDVAKLAEYGRTENVPANWNDVENDLIALRRIRRRQLDLEEVCTLLSRAEALLEAVEQAFGLKPHREFARDTGKNTEYMTANDGQNERHYQNSIPDTYDLEPCLEERQGAADDVPTPTDMDAGNRVKEDDSPRNKLPLGLVMRACPEIRAYAGGKVDSCQQLIATAHTVRAMMGISPDAWQNALDVMGDYEASVVLAAILQRFDSINSAGGYLRALTDKAARGEFSPVPMIMALTS